MTRRTCPLCECPTTSTVCCGIDLTARREPFKMTPERIKQVRAIAHGRKGLDKDEYRLFLVRTGAEHTADLTREQFRALLAALDKLPDVAKYRGVARARA